MILEALIFTENLGNALPSLVCETKIAWQSNQSCARPTVLNVLEEVASVVHTVAPEKYRFWKSNQGGLASLCKRPIALKRGTQGKIAWM